MPECISQQKGGGITERPTRAPCNIGEEADRRAQEMIDAARHEAAIRIAAAQRESSNIRATLEAEHNELVEKVRLLQAAVIGMIEHGAAHFPALEMVIDPVLEAVIDPMLETVLDVLDPGQNDSLAQKDAL